MKAAFYVFFPAGGIGKYTHHLLKEMGQEHPDEIALLCAPTFQWQKHAGVCEFPELMPISHPFPVLRKLKFLLGQWVNPKRAAKILGRENIPIVHFSQINHLTFPFWKKAYEKLGVKVVISVHDVQRQKAILNRHWEEKNLKALYKFADALIVHSKFQAEELAAYAGISSEKIAVVPHGPYPYPPPKENWKQLRQKYQLPAHKKIALFFGLIRDEKNLENLIRTLPALREELHLVVAGSTVPRHRGVQFYQALARQLGVDENITFVPRHIPDEEVGEFFVMSDWVALPYDSSFSSQSGVLNIATHFQKPVLVSEAPVLRETLESCKIGVISSSDQATQLEVAIKTLHDQLANGFLFEFERYDQLFGWKENVRITTQLYQNLLHNK